MRKIISKSGLITAYGLACGYKQDYYNDKNDILVTIEKNSSCFYNVIVFNKFREVTSFDTLTEARKFAKRSLR